MRGDLSTSTTTYETVIMLTLFPFLFSLYVFTVCVIVKNPKDFRNSYYTLILGLAASDFAMLLYTIYSFIYDIVGFAYLGRSVDAALSFLLYYVLGWYSTQIYTVLLASNRFFAIVLFLIYKKYFSVKLSLIWISCCISVCFTLWCSMLVYVQFLYLPRFKVAHFFPYTISGAYTKEWNMVVKLDECLSYAVACYVMALYSFCLLYSFFKASTFQSASRASYLKEIKILFQGFTIGVMLCLLSFMHWMYPPASLNRIVTWLYCALNPIVYLSFDGTLRQRFFKKLKSLKLSTVSNSVIHLMR